MSLIIVERTANLNGPIIPDALAGVLNGSEIDAHKFVITATRDGATVALTGTVTASFLRADGAEVVLTGEIEDGAATVTLAQSCYAVPGRFALTVFVTADGVKTGVYACMGGVRNTTSGTIIDPGQVVPSLDDIIAEYSNMQTAEAAATAAAQSAATAAATIGNTAQAIMNVTWSGPLNAPTMAKGGVSPTGGTNLSYNSNKMTCKWGYVEYDRPLLVTMTDSDYKINVWTYTSGDVGTKIASCTNSDYTQSPVVVPFETSAEALFFRVGFYKIDESTITDDMLDGILASLKVEELTDKALTASNAAADAKATGDRLNTIDIQVSAIESGMIAQDGLNKRDRFRLIQWKKNSSPNATGAISSMTVIGGKLFIFKYTELNDSVDDNKAYTINADGTVDFTTGVTFASNLGHANTVNWNPLNGCLLTMRTPVKTDLNDGKRTLIIIPNVTESTTAFDRTASDAVNIDLDMTITVDGVKAFGDYRLNAVWGPNTVLDAGSGGSGAALSNLIYVVSDDSSENSSGNRRLALLQLATGANTTGFNYGTAHTAEAGAFNGLYNVLQVWTQEWTAVNGIAQGNNDATFFDGKIYEIPAPTSVAGFPFMIHSFDNFGLTWKTERLMIPLRSLAGGANAWEKGGCAIYNGRLYTSAKSAGLFVFEF